MHRLVFITMTVFAILIVHPFPAQAQACTGSSPNWTASSWNDFRACVNQAQDGDTITGIPGGHWTAALGEGVAIAAKYLIINGTDVTITDNTCTGKCTNVSLFSVTDSPAGHTIIRGFTIDAGTGVHSSPAAVFVLSHTRTTPQGLVMRLTHTTYNNSANQSGDYISAKTNTGLIDHNSMRGGLAYNTCLGETSFLRHVDTSGGEAEWERPMLWGNKDINGDKALYVEDNDLYIATQGVDGDDNSRQVYRFNQNTFASWGTHGVDSSPFGNRAAELYKNVLYYDNRAQNCIYGMPADMNVLTSMRGGTAMWLSNTITNISTGAWFGTRRGIGMNVWMVDRGVGIFRCWGRLEGANPAYQSNDGSFYPVPRQAGMGFIDQTPHDFVRQTNDGRTWTFDHEPMYFAGNIGGSTGAANFSEDNPTGVSGWDAPELQYGCAPKYPQFADFEDPQDYLHHNRDIFLQAGNGGPQTSPTTPFNGMTGTGWGPRSMRPPTCVGGRGAGGVAYWATDQGNWNHSDHGGQGVLDKCINNAWVDNWYVPYTYPHPLNTDGPVGPRIIWTHQPTSLTGMPGAALSFPTPLSAQMQPASPDQLQLSVATGNCTLANPNQTANAQGQATWTSLTVSAATLPQTCSLRLHNASNSAVADLVSGDFTINPPGLPTLTWVQQPVTTTADQAMNPSPSVQLASNQSGVQVTLQLNGCPTVTFPVLEATSGANGLTVFTLTPSGLGSGCNLTATAPGHAPSMTSAAFDVTAAPNVGVTLHVTVASGNCQLSGPQTAIVMDQFWSFPGLIVSTATPPAQCTLQIMDMASGAMVVTMPFNVIAGSGGAVLAFTQQPTNTPSGQAITPPIAGTITAPVGQQQQRR